MSLASSSRLPLRLLQRRALSTTSAVHLPPKADASLRPKINTLAQRVDLDMAKLGPFPFDDITSLGHLRLEEQREILSYLRKVEQDFPIIESECTRSCGQAGG